MKISQIELRRLSIPLKTPYKLAFGEVRSYETVLVELTTDSGSSGLGEATLLPGYTEETADDCWTTAERIAPLILARSMAEARAEIDRFYPSRPFTVAAFTTAIEMIEAHDLLSVSETVEVPILAAVGGTGEQEVADSIESALTEGYRTLKVKVGFEARSDLERVKLVQRLLGERARIRIDANQGYTEEDGAWFASSLDPAGIELFEQPCPADAWDALARIARVATVPMMLDESILVPDDISRAAELEAARFIKLKLMKVGGLARLRKAVDLIYRNDMEPVLGNGVATGVGCWMEACAATTLVTTAGEMNGFLKPARQLLAQPLAVREGCVVVESGYRPRLEPSAVDDMQLAHRRY